MDEVREILANMGLGQFANSFESEGYDNVKLIEALTSEDAEELCDSTGMKKGHKTTFCRQYKQKFSLSNALINQERLALRQYLM